MIGSSSGRKVLVPGATPYLAYLSIFIVFSYLIIGRLFEYASSQSPVVSELLSAAFAAIITISAMTVMMRFQTQQEKDKEFSAQLFDRKLAIYIDLVKAIFEADDDNCISGNEMLDIENRVGTACLISSEDLVSIFSQFMVQIKVYGVLYFRSMDSEQVKHFREFVEGEKEKNDIHGSYLARQKYELRIPVEGNEGNYFVSLDDLIQAIRDDLVVIKGDVRQEIEHFIRMEMDRENMMRKPSIVDKDRGCA